MSARPARARTTREQREAIIEVLYEHGMAFDELARGLGSQLQLHTTDATALVEILQAEDRGEPLTQSGLSRRVGLTAGATSSLLNRLEEAGHVRRERTNPDRRIVTLHATPEVDDQVVAFFSPLAAAMHTALARYSPDTLTQFHDLLTDIVAAMNAHAGRSGDIAD